MSYRSIIEWGAVHLADVASCPFCHAGNTGLAVVPSGYAVFCASCRAFGPVHGVGAAAVAAWNTRSLSVLQSVHPDGIPPSSTLLL